MSPSTDLVAAQLRSTAATESPSRHSAGSDTWIDGWASTAPTGGSGAGSDSSRRRTERIPYIDMARGLFLILMASTHAMTLAGIQSASFLARWGLPRGWATTGLIMLCGFMVATFARQMEERSRIRQRVVRRAKELLVVMLASNAIMMAIRQLVTHETEPLFSLEWWSGVLVGSEWSISGILLPIGLLLLVCPVLVALYDRCRSRPRQVMLAGGLLLFAAFTWSVPSLVPDLVAYHRALDVMFGAGAGGFPVIPMIGSGVLGFLLGVFWQPPQERFDRDTMFGAILLFVAARQLLSATPGFLTVVVGRTLVDVSHLVLMIALATGLIHWRPSRRALRFVPLLGCYSLFTFLVHRVVEQTLSISLRPYGLPSELLYVVCFGGGLIGLVELLTWRPMFPSYDRLLRTLYL